MELIVITTIMVVGVVIKLALSRATQDNESSGMSHINFPNNQRLYEMPLIN